MLAFKKTLMCSALGNKKGAHIIFWGVILGVKGVRNGPFSATKSLVYFFFLAFFPLDKDQMNSKMVVVVFGSSLITYIYILYINIFPPRSVFTPTCGALNSISLRRDCEEEVLGSLS